MPTPALPYQVSKVKPTVLLGVSGAGGIFTRDILQTMARHMPLHACEGA